MSVTDLQLDHGFFVGALLGFVLSRSGIIGVLAGIVIGLMISKTHWCDWGYIQSCWDSRN